MRISSRRRAIAFFVVLGVCLVLLAIGLNVGWIILNWREGVLLFLGIVFFALLIAGLIVNTSFLVREIRRNEQHDSFINAVTHELKTPIASIRLYLQTLQHRDVDEAQRREFYRLMLDDTDRLLGTVEQVLKAGEVGHKKQDRRVPVDFADWSATAWRWRAPATIFNLNLCSMSNPPTAPEPMCWAIPKSCGRPFPMFSTMP